METIDLTEFISAVITLVVVVITTFLVPYLKTKIDENNFAEMYSWVQIAVSAAEMIYSGPGRGEEKKEYVLQYFNSKGYKIDMESLNVLIESAVLELQQAVIVR